MYWITRLRVVWSRAGFLLAASALLADSHLAGSALAPVGDGGDRRLTGAAAGDAAIAVHGSHGGVAAHPDDEVVVALPAGVKIGFGAGSSAVISSSISLTSSSKFEDCPRSDGAACAAGAARSSPLSTRAAASRVILFIG